MAEVQCHPVDGRCWRCGRLDRRTLRQRCTIRSRLDSAFAAESGAITYCGNGYGTGIDNDVPWWEWTLLADGTPSAFADDLLPALRINGFDVASSPGSPAEYGEFSTLNNPDHLASIGWATSWIRIDGSNTAGISVLARVADATTRNNCFPKAGDVVTDADPADADVIAVIMFRNTGD